MRLPAAIFLVRRIVRLLGAMLLLSAPVTALALQADQVVLKNGDRFTGHILSATADTLTLATDAAGIIAIRRDAIARVIPSQIIPSQALSGQASLGQQPIVRAVLPATAVPPALHCMANLKPVPSSWSLALQGAPNTVVLGTQSEEQFGAAASLSLCEANPRNTTNLTASGNHARVYEEKSASIRADIAAAEIEQQHFLHTPQGAAIFAVGGVFTNNSLGMAMQKSIGVGLLSPQGSRKALFYDFAADLRYLNQHLDHTSPSLNLAGLRLKQQTHAQAGFFTWNEQAWIMPIFNDVHALQAYASIEPSIALKPWLHLGLNEEESYLGNAPQPNRKNYFSSTLSLTLLGASGSRSK